LKVKDENSRIRIQDPDPEPNPDPDPIVRGMDPRILIHTKMSWIRNTVSYLIYLLLIIFVLQVKHARAHAQMLRQTIASIRQGL
jgi:hypothetical protein